MNLDKVQKINSLASDLLKQGLAKDREDAVFQAEKAFQSQAGDYISMRQRLETDQKSAIPVESVALTQDEIKSILEQNSQFLVKKIKEFEDKVTVLEQQIAALKTSQRISYSNQGSSSSGGGSSSEATPPPGTIIRQERPKEEKKDDASGHHRTGKFNPDDVSIEKFFNYSHK